METFHFNDAQYVNLCDVFDSCFLLTNQKTLLISAIVCSIYKKYGIFGLNLS